ncbi:type II toxin-antitoxin system CcdA family antitoxin [Xanthomonas sp. NCPPB 2632]|uniref:type II toxin-antitoxin system CcdA family antitoxin n=1 Tax=Xanthomonas sp. NCPPB 2632 TaxID=3240912 RepID=UPI003514C6A1
MLALIGVDPAAPKKPVNLTLNSDLVSQVRQETDNLSAQVECLLIDFLQSRRGAAADRAASLDRAARGWNEFLDKNGSFGDEFLDL